MKNKKLKKYIVLSGMLFFIPLFLLLFFGKFMKHEFGQPPYFSPECPTGCQTSNYQIPDFVLYDQNNNLVTRDSLFGNIWLAAFFDLQNPHLPKITERLLSVNFKYKDKPNLCVVCINTGDTADVAAMKKYVETNSRYNLNTKKFMFLHGDSAAVASLIRNGFLITDPANQAMFKLIDDKGHIRGEYGNTEYHMQDAMEDMAILNKAMRNERRGKE